MKRPVVIGVVVVAALALGAGIVYAVSSSGNGDSKSAGSTKHTTTTTKTAKPGSAVTSPTSGSTSSSIPDSTDPPDPSNAYQPVPLPTGVSATIGTCKWAPKDGGELEAAGTITNIAGQDDVWLITSVWLQQNQSQHEAIDQQSDVVNLAVGQSVPWHLSISASSAPPSLSCALEIE